MSTADVPSSNLYWPDSVPVRLLAHSESSSGNTVTSVVNPSTPGAIIVLGIDTVAKAVGAIQCFVDYYIPDGTVVYHDSQSIGEGQGVRFPWRGQAVVAAGEVFRVTFSSVSSVQWSVGAWGLALPFNTF